MVFPNPLSYSPIQQARFTRWENEVGETKNRETEMGRRAKKVTADRDQEVRTGQDRRKEVFMPKRERREKKGKEGGR